MRIHVVIATLGRPEVAAQTVALLWRQTRAPDSLTVVGVTENDVMGIAEVAPRSHIEFAPKGSCSQRNHGLALARGVADLIFFFDDDFVAAADYLAQAEKMFEADSVVVGAGGRVIADGVVTGGITFDDAVTLVQRDLQSVPRTQQRRTVADLYGCNMAYRVAALDGMTFDENLPFYGWLEDVDFSHRVRRRGRLVIAQAMAGVHMGSPFSRSPGLRLGYSQVANPLYLIGKGGIRVRKGLQQLATNVTSNLLKSTILNNQTVDYKGRLQGNIKALRDAVSGSMHPTRIREL